MITYEVNDSNEVLAWNTESNQSEPFLFQPHYPNGVPFGSKEDAQAWAEAWYAHFTDPQANPDFPTGPSL